MALILISLSMTACLPKRVPIEKTKVVTVVKMDLNKKDSTSLTQDGITIKAKAIHPDNISQYAGLTTKLDYWWYRTDAYGKRIKYKNGKYSTRKDSIDFNLIAYPAFEVKITNSTKHVLRFSKAVISVEDDKGNVYDALVKRDLNDYIYQSMESQLKEDYKLFKKSQTNLTTKMKSIRLLDNNLKVLPGKTVKAYVAANYGKYSSQDAKKFLTGEERITLGLYEVPSKVNDAGDAVKTTNFNFVFDVNVKEETQKYTVYRYKLQ